MALFDFLRASPYTDAVLGVVVRRGGRWQGRISLPPEGDGALLLAGGRTAPDDSSVRLARELAPRYGSLRPAIAQALFEHYEPYRQAVDAGEMTEVRDVPRLDRSDQVWLHVTLVRVLIEPLGRIDTVEIAYRTTWDEEHTLGARFQNWALVELNGSVI
jgi:hypothetical protein